MNQFVVELQEQPSYRPLAGRQAEDLRAALELLVAAELLRQVAAESGVVASPAEIDQQLALLEKGDGGHEATERRYASNGVPPSALLTDIESLVLLEKLGSEKALDTNIRVVVSPRFGRWYPEHKTITVSPWSIAVTARAGSTLPAT